MVHQVYGIFASKFYFYLKKKKVFLNISMPTIMIFYLSLAYLIKNKSKILVGKNIFNENDPLIHRCKVKLHKQKQTFVGWLANYITIICKSLFSSYLFQIHRK